MFEAYWVPTAQCRELPKLVLTWPEGLTKAELEPHSPEKKHLHARSIWQNIWVVWKESSKYYIWKKINTIKPPCCRSVAFTSAQSTKRESQNHSMIEWLALEGTPRISKFQPPCHRQGRKWWGQGVCSSAVSDYRLAPCRLFHLRWLRLWVCWHVATGSCHNSFSWAQLSAPSQQEKASEQTSAW